MMMKMMRKAMKVNKMMKQSNNLLKKVDKLQYNKTKEDPHSCLKKMKIMNLEVVMMIVVLIGNQPMIQIKICEQTMQIMYI